MKRTWFERTGGFARVVLEVHTGSGGDVIDTARVMVGVDGHVHESVTARTRGLGVTGGGLATTGASGGGLSTGVRPPAGTALGFVVPLAPVLEDRRKFAPEVVRARFQAAEGVAREPIADVAEYGHSLNEPSLGAAEARRRVFFYWCRARQEAHAVNLSFRAWSESAASIKLIRDQRRFYCARGEHERYRWRW